MASSTIASTSLLPGFEHATPSQTSTKRGGITAALVPEEKRSQFLPTAFGARLMMQVENAVFDWMSELCPTYNGGLWQFYNLSNGGAYMAPDETKPMRIVMDGNGFDAEVSADAAGIIATVMALNSLIWKGHHELMHKYEQLMDYASEHPEGGSIRAALD